MRILLIERDDHATSIVAREFGQLGFEVEVASDGRRGLQRALYGGHDVVLLDLALPKMDGQRVLSELRRMRVNVPVLVLSVRDAVGERVRMLNGGADDFMVKPFCFDELVARVNALARRPQNLAASVIEVADLRMDLQTRCVERAGQTVTLSAKEFALLRLLLKHRGSAVTRAMIAERVWGQSSRSFSNVIDVYICYLRAKLDDEHQPRLIHTLRGVGYMLSECSPPGV